ncbi:MAG: hypothetical protein MPJ24_04535 [Pirellulaceae bacterium]|nr:hypothetical protein [Pirellulaceae bacterium]
MADKKKKNHWDRLASFLITGEEPTIEKEEESFASVEEVAQEVPEAANREEEVVEVEVGEEDLGHWDGLAEDLGLKPAPRKRVVRKKVTNEAKDITQDGSGRESDLDNKEIFSKSEDIQANSVLSEMFQPSDEFDHAEAGDRFDLPAELEGFGVRRTTAQEIVTKNEVLEEESTGEELRERPRGRSDKNRDRSRGSRNQNSRREGRGKATQSQAATNGEEIVDDFEDQLPREEEISRRGGRQANRSRQSSSPRGRSRRSREDQENEGEERQERSRRGSRSPRGNDSQQEFEEDHQDQVPEKKRQRTRSRRRSRNDYDKDPQEKKVTHKNIPTWEGVIAPVVDNNLDRSPRSSSRGRGSRRR